MFGPNVFGVPGGQRVVGERVAEIGRTAVRRVRVPEVHMQEPAVVGAAPVQPVQHDLGHFVGELHPPLARVVHFVEVGVPVPGRVPFGEGADRGGVEADVAERAHPAGFSQRRLETPFGPLHKGLRSRAAVVDHAVVNAETAAEKGRPTRHARGIGDVQVFETNTIGGQRIDVGAGGPVVSVAAEVVGAQRIDVDVKDSHGMNCKGLIRHVRNRPDQKGRALPMQPSCRYPWGPMTVRPTPPIHLRAGIRPWAH